MGVSKQAQGPPASLERPEQPPLELEARCHCRAGRGQKAPRRPRGTFPSPRPAQTSGPQLQACWGVGDACPAPTTHIPPSAARIP